MSELSANQRHYLKTLKRQKQWVIFACSGSPCQNGR